MNYKLNLNIKKNILEKTSLRYNQEKKRKIRKKIYQETQRKKKNIKKEN